MIDSNSFDIAYGTIDVANNNSLSTGLPVIDGKANPDGEFTLGWTDEPVEGVDYYYMATAKSDNGL